MVGDGIICGIIVANQSRESKENVKWNAPIWDQYFIFHLFKLKN